MLKKYLRNLSVLYYVQLSEKELSVTEIKSGREYRDEPLVAIRKNDNQAVAFGRDALRASLGNIEIVNPLKHKRTVLADFLVAEKLLSHAFKTLGGNNIVAPSPRVIMHQTEKNEGGLTQIERRALHELAAGLGCREIIVYEGPILNISSIDFDRMKSNDQNGRKNRNRLTKIDSFFWIYLIGALIIILILTFGQSWTPTN